MEVAHRSHVLHDQVDGDVRADALGKPADREDAPNEARVAPNEPELSLEKASGRGLVARRAGGPEKQAAGGKRLQEVDQRIQARAEQVVEIVGEAPVRQAVLRSPWVQFHRLREAGVDLAIGGRYEATAVREANGILDPKPRLRDALAESEKGNWSARPGAVGGPLGGVDVEPLPFGVAKGDIAWGPNWANPASAWTAAGCHCPGTGGAADEAPLAVVTPSRSESAYRRATSAAS